MMVQFQLQSGENVVKTADLAKEEMKSLATISHS